MGKANFTFNDYSNELSSVGVTIDDPIEANFDADLALVAALGVAIGALSIGAYVKRSVNIIPFDSLTTPSNVYAQREIKWLVTYRGNVSGKNFQIEIPAANLTATLQPNSDQADLTATLWTNFETAFEAIAASPDDPDESVTLISARVVGRNL